MQAKNDLTISDLVLDDAAGFGFVSVASTTFSVAFAVATGTAASGAGNQRQEEHTTAA